MLMKNKRFDLHMHSIYSDGEDTPAALVRMAIAAGLSMVALTDHDSISGVREMMEEGRRQGIAVVPAVELDTEWREEVHMLGYGIDLDDPALNRALMETAERRDARNEAILQKLDALGCRVRAHLRRAAGTMTRFDIALALVSAGYVPSAPEAFARYLEPGMPAYVKPDARPTPKEAIARIRRAGGVPVLAHPCHIRTNPHALIHGLVEDGLMGLEVYYPSSTQGQTALFRSLAEQYGLLQTAGSDYHGAARRNVALGSPWRDTGPLRASFDFFLAYSRSSAHILS